MALRAADGKFLFGPLFFLERLGPLVRDHCRAPAERLPTVLLHLTDGEVIDVCHFAGLAPRWAVVAAYARERRGEGPGVMETILLPYEAIARITIREDVGEGSRIGFHQEREPRALTGGTLAAAPAGPTAASPSGPGSGEPPGTPEGRPGTERGRAPGTP